MGQNLNINIVANKRRFESMIVVVKYQVATYSGEVKINCDPSDENEYIIARAKSIVTRQAGGHLPFGYESWKIVSTDITHSPKPRL